MAVTIDFSIVPRRGVHTVNVLNADKVFVARCIPAISVDGTKATSKIYGNMSLTPEQVQEAAVGGVALIYNRLYRDAMEVACIADGRLPKPTPGAPKSGKHKVKSEA